MTSKKLEDLANESLDKFGRYELLYGEDGPLFDFIKAFNALKCGYHACPNNRGGVDIVINTDGRLMASLMPRQSLWAIEKSIFSYKELLLMANLSAALLGLRGGFNDD